MTLRRHGKQKVKGIPVKASFGLPGQTVFTASLKLSVVVVDELLDDPHFDAETYVAREVISRAREFLAETEKFVEMP